MYRLDSHIHCQYSPDSSTKIDDIIKKSIEDKIDIIAISDHNTVEGSKVAVEKTKNTENLLVIPSIEISSSKGHILGFGCEEVIPRDLEPEETIDMIHNQGGLAIIPHPFCFYSACRLLRFQECHSTVSSALYRQPGHVLQVCGRNHCPLPAG